MKSAKIKPRVCAAILLSLLGCNPTPAARDRHHLEPPPTIAVTSAQMQELVESSDSPVVVEFGVDIGCARCDDMRRQVAELSRNLEGTAQVVRVDFNANRELAAQFGANVCPSYVIFDQGQAISAHSYPTSADLIRIDLESRVLQSNGF